MCVYCHTGGTGVACACLSVSQVQNRGFNPNSNEGARGSGPWGNRKEGPGRHWSRPQERQAWNLSLENCLCDSCPSFRPGHQPTSKGQAPELCFLGAPPSQRLCGPRYEEGIVRIGLGLGRGESARARPGSCPRRKLWNRHAASIPNPSGRPTEPSPAAPPQSQSPGSGSSSWKANR